MADLLPSLILAGLLWTAIVPLLSYRATAGRGLERHERLRLAVVVAGKTLLWLGTVGLVAVLALLVGGMKVLAVALMGLMFLLFAVVATVQAGSRSEALTQPERARR